MILTIADEATRVRQGANPATEPDRLRQLAHDESVRVRATLAMNPSSPLEADMALAADPDERVRVLLARKLAGFTKGLPCAEGQRLRDQAFKILAGLVADEAVRVRAAIAEAVRDLPDAPRAMILALAHDNAVTVSEPIVLFSPLLTPEDLLALVAAAPSADTVIAVARRPGIDSRVSDAVAASANAAAIHALLANSSAQIREAALDALIAASADHTDWQEPLVRRPALSSAASRALSDIVASHLLAIMAARTDLDPDVAASIATRLGAGSEAPMAETAADRALTEALRLSRAGLLTEQVLLSAVRRGDVPLVSAVLAVSAEVPVETVERAAALRSAKGLISLVWQAGFSMRAGVAVQGLLALLPPGEAMAAGPGGGFPLSLEEMNWHMASLARGGRR